ncbi:MAG: peptide chain release factor N(5)-glutamine methyltransferase [Candidatus Omnitrophica bacterium]|nr:peptide chain release factor N(5)-glutamine methyltransferase [Candidatus Omnitrophota bacterium]
MDELELILTDIFRCSRTDLYLNSPSIAFSDREFRALDKILKDRGQTRPIQYILGYTEFMGLRLNVKRDVLIPRQETEILVETVIGEKIKIKNPRPANYKSQDRPWPASCNCQDRPWPASCKSQDRPWPVNYKGQDRQKSPSKADSPLEEKLKILDIGTGSGCIAIALAKFLEDVDIVATDISKQALNLAKENAKLHKTEENIRFLKADLFSHIFFKTDIKFDIIVSNPPYVPTSEIGIFDVTVTNEPKLALDGGADGLDFYRRISRETRKFLKQDGLLFLELGDNQSDRIKEIFSDGWVIEKFIKDYQDIERVCIIKRSNEDATYGTK